MKKQELISKAESRLTSMHGIDDASIVYSHKDDELETVRLKAYLKARKVPINPYDKLGRVVTVRTVDLESYNFTVMFCVDQDEFEGELK